MSESAPFGMARSLTIPIAATNEGAIAQHVGAIEDVKYHPKVAMLPLAIKVEIQRSEALPRDAPLWTLPRAKEYYDILYAPKQLWVHVNCNDYRNVWTQMMGAVGSSEIFLDHVENRRCTRLRNYSYPYIRLVPVTRAVNTNAGHRAGGEGKEYAYTLFRKRSMSAADWAHEQMLKRNAHSVIYADPFDLTKMLGISPGTQVLAGVGAFHDNFFE